MRCFKDPAVALVGLSLAVALEVTASKHRTRVAPPVEVVSAGQPFQFGVALNQGPAVIGSQFPLASGRSSSMRRTRLARRVG